MTDFQDGLHKWIASSTKAALLDSLSDVQELYEYLHATPEQIEVARQALRTASDNLVSSFGASQNEALNTLQPHPLMARIAMAHVLAEQALEFPQDDLAFLVHRLAICERELKSAVGALLGIKLSDFRFAQERLTELTPLAEHGEKFRPRGRGEGSVKKLVRFVMKGKFAKASARELWNICAQSPKAAKLGIEFYESHAWTHGHGYTSFARFSNIVSEVRSKPSRNSEPVKR